MLHLRVITPQKVVLEEDIKSITIPSSEGEITILPKHEKLFTLLKEGVVMIKKEGKEDHLAIGGGYLETDGRLINLLVSRAYGQDKIDSEETQKAIDRAKKIISTSKDENEREQALGLLRRSAIDMKLIKKRKARSV